MKIKRISIPLAVLLLLTTLGSTLIFSLPAVFANPVCGATITKNTTLTANIGPCSGAGLIIGANGITLNCAGLTISGKKGNTNDGIYLNGVTGVTVKNCKVTGFFDGFYLDSSSSNTLTKNTADSNGRGCNNDGFTLADSSGNTLTKNTANSNGEHGFSLLESSGNSLLGNTANGNGILCGGIGFYVFDSSSNTLTKNTANGNSNYGFWLTGSLSTGNTLTKNIANSNTFYGYLDETSSSSAGVPHWDTANSYTGDKGSGNGSDLAYGNANLDTATSPF